jgi:hypothetical protein
MSRSGVDPHAPVGPVEDPIGAGRGSLSSDSQNVEARIWERTSRARASTYLAAAAHLQPDGQDPHGIGDRALRNVAPPGPGRDPGLALRNVASPWSGGLGAGRGWPSETSPPSELRFRTCSSQTSPPSSAGSGIWGDQYVAPRLARLPSPARRRHLPPSEFPVQRTNAGCVMARVAVEELVSSFRMSRSIPGRGGGLIGRRTQASGAVGRSPLVGRTP